MKTLKNILLFTVVFTIFSCSDDDNEENPQPITVSTLAGSTVGYADGTKSEAQFNYPTGVSVDASGNIYVADLGNHKIRKITIDGVVTTIAGSTQGFEDGNTNPKFNNPVDVAVDANGNIYVADLYNHRVRKIDPTGAVSTLAGSTAGYQDGTGSNAKFHNVNGVAVDIDGNVYVTDHGNNKIRKITPQGVVTTLAGSTAGFANGVGSEAKFNLLKGIAVDGSGNVYVTDNANQKIRKITPNGTVSTLAGSDEGSTDGAGDIAQFSYPTDITVDTSGNVYVADWNNNKIRKISPSGNVTTLAGSDTSGYVDGTVDVALFNKPYGIAVSPNNTVYVASPSNVKIREISQ